MQALELEDSDDDSLKALHYVLEAWERGTDAGVAPELMAYASLYAALSDLVSAFGEEAVAGLANTLVTRIQSGEFTLYRTRQ